MQCMDSENKRHIKDFNSHGVSYFVQYFERADDPADIWNDVEEKKAEIVNAVFSSKTSELCQVAKNVIEKAVRRKVFNRELGFSGLAVVRCGRQFVWYQLGYRYFFVAGSAGDSYELASSNGAYDANCGQIFLFP
ncbi:hypothetical protein AAVH_26238 [Aphelenchoides avenae]|nr:hypothetical protein AAVH_26238 [Aphelenchus avenae]